MPKKRKVPKHVREYILKMDGHRKEAVRLIRTGIVDTKLRKAIRAVGVSHAAIEAFLDKTNDARLKRIWIQIVNDEFEMILEHYKIEFDALELIQTRAE